MTDTLDLYTLIRAEDLDAYGRPRAPLAPLAIDALARIVGPFTADTVVEAHLRPGETYICSIGTVRRLLPVTVSRATWLRGEGSAASKLYRSSDGKMCCLGSAALAGGLTLDQITDCGAIDVVVGERIPVEALPVALRPLLSAAPPLVQVINSDAAHKLMSINDDDPLGEDANDHIKVRDDATEAEVEAERERLIAETGPLAGLAFTFTD